MLINNTYLGKNTTLPFSFDLQAKVPLDSRQIVPVYAGLEALVNNNAAYEGMIVYVEEKKKTYQYIKQEENSFIWKELGIDITEFINATIVKKPQENDIKTQDDYIREARRIALDENGTRCLRFTPGVYEIDWHQSLTDNDGNEVLHFFNENDLTIIIDKGAIIKNKLKLLDLTKEKLKSAIDIYFPTLIQNEIENKYNTSSLTLEEIKIGLLNTINSTEIREKYNVECDEILDITISEKEMKNEKRQFEYSVTASSSGYTYGWFNPDLQDEDNPNGLDKNIDSYRSRISPLLKLNTPKTKVFKFVNCSNIKIYGGGTIEGELSSEEWLKNSILPKDQFTDEESFNLETGRKGERLHNFYWSDWILQNIAIKIESCTNVTIHDIEIRNFYGRGINIGMEGFKGDDSEILTKYPYGIMTNYAATIREQLQNNFIITSSKNGNTRFSFLPSKNITITNIDIHHTLAEAFMLTGAENVLVDNTNIWEIGSKLSYGFDIEGTIYYGDAGPAGALDIYTTIERETDTYPLETTDVIDPNTLYLLKNNTTYRSKNPGEEEVPKIEANATKIEYNEYALIHNKVTKLNSRTVSRENITQETPWDLDSYSILRALKPKYIPVIPSNNNVLIKNCYIKNGITTNAMTWATMVGKASDNILFENVIGADAGSTLNGHKMNSTNNTNGMNNDPDFQLIWNEQMNRYIPIVFADVARWDADVDRPKNVVQKNCSYPVVNIRNNFLVEGGKISRINIQEPLPETVTPSPKIIGNNFYNYSIVDTPEDRNKLNEETAAIEDKTILCRTINPPAIYKGVIKKGQTEIEWEADKLPFLSKIQPYPYSYIDENKETHIINEMDLKPCGVCCCYSPANNTALLIKFNNKAYSGLGNATTNNNSILLDNMEIIWENNQFNYDKNIASEYFTIEEKVPRYENDKIVTSNLLKITDMTLPLCYIEFDENGVISTKLMVEFYKMSKTEFTVSIPKQISTVKNINSRISEITSSVNTENAYVEFVNCGLTSSSTNFLPSVNSGEIIFKNCDFILNQSTLISNNAMYSNFSFDNCYFKTTYNGGGPITGGVIQARNGEITLSNCNLDLTSISSQNTDIKITLIHITQPIAKVKLINNLINTHWQKKAGSQDVFNYSINKNLVKTNYSYDYFNGQLYFINNQAPNVQNLYTTKKYKTKEEEADKDLDFNNARIIVINNTLEPTI